MALPSLKIGLTRPMVSAPRPRECSRCSPDYRSDEIGQVREGEPPATLSEGDHFVPVRCLDRSLACFPSIA